MFNIVKQGDHSTAYVTAFIADTESDIENLPTNVAPGSTCFVINNSKKYMLNNELEWKITSSDSGGGTAGVSVVNVSIDDDGHLICDMSDGTKIDAGKIPSAGFYADKESLPPIGDSSTLYIAGSSILKWNDETEEYEDLLENVVQWGSF